MGEVERGLRVIGEIPESGVAGMLIATTSCEGPDTAGGIARGGRRDAVVSSLWRRVRLTVPWSLSAIQPWCGNVPTAFPRCWDVGGDE